MDDEFIKSSEGILSILQIIVGLLSWCLMASLPYNQMIYTGGETAQFHCIMACKLFEDTFSELKNNKRLVLSKLWTKNCLLNFVTYGVGIYQNYVKYCLLHG